MNIAFDAFGTLLHFDGRRLNPYFRLIEGFENAPRLPFLTRNVPPAVFAEELGRAHLTPLIERELATEIAAIKPFNDVLGTLFQLRADREVEAVPFDCPRCR